MAPLLALDIGNRHTGVAYGDDATGIVFSMNTIDHKTKEEMAAAVKTIVTARKITKLIVGLPLLPGGDEGEQSGKVRAAAAVLENTCKLPVVFIDERFTSVHRDGARVDPDARSALAILQIALERSKNGY